ncbi:sugar lactone lactonase YvrE [Motilibacter peucedani]|uniref:Sugar lactone lactonase YvrE n=1 Tax=Motilibacter peucedani TaxID=598650 RepID=A0A420XKF1_9ACTN|nr:SMP-30/gluconolactonase/LRE family protein [Motilibacter peucedani]RKS68506.1 sugar lactone lactonase YvrE [Motilibacter peucedani]
MRSFVADPVSEDLLEHGEGPRWDAVRDELVCVDIMAGAVHRWAFRGGRLAPVRSYVLDRPVGAANPLADGSGWLLAAGTGFVRLDEDGTTTELVDAAPGRGEVLRMNEAVCDPAGRVVAGLMAYDTAPGSGWVVSGDLDGGVRTLIPRTTIANGTAWDSEGTTMFWSDSGEGTLAAFGYDPATGALGARREVLRRDRADGVADGIALDDDGCVWAALWGGRSVLRVNPTGEVLAVVDLPVDQPSAVAFAGTTLLVTTSREGLDASTLAGQPLAGALFAVDVGVSGPPARPFRGELPERLV